MSSFFRFLCGVLFVATACAASATRPAEIDGRSYDLIVVGATPGGIACALRAAREGLSVLLVQHTRHVGGMLTNGLCQWDALYAGHRAPIFNEYAAAIAEHYRRTYGEKSAQHRVARFSQDHYPLSRFEPSVAEREFLRLLEAQARITLLLAHYPVAVDRDGPLLRGITLREFDGPRETRVRASIFADATYEGDLAALARVPYRVGREARTEYNEPHAGKCFTNISRKSGPKDALEGRLNLHPYAHTQGDIDPASPFTADAAIQAYNYRFCISSNPRNLRLPEKPATYNREEYVHYNRKSMNPGSLNAKGSFNAAILPGENHAYPDADWPARKNIIQRHRDFALGLMYFLQNDESIPEAKRREYRRIGLPLDEYPDNDNIPYEMYVREARRIVGRYVFREQDNSFAPGLSRTPIHPDSIAITDWSMDSHACTTETKPGYDFDGKLILTEESRPAQVPYRTLLPTGVDNLLVPVCLSATHVAWGAVRLEPVFMQVGEAAGFAAALSLKHNTTPAALDSDLLIRTLVRSQFMVSFFNDTNIAAADPCLPAVQYFGVKGFFDSYDARPDKPLTTAVAALWADAFAQRRANTSPDATTLALAIANAQPADTSPVPTSDFAAKLKSALSAAGARGTTVDSAVESLTLDLAAPITRGDACRLMFDLIERTTSRPSAVNHLPGATAYAFKSVPGSQLRLHVFTPPGHKPSDSRPAIVFFFGGGWDHGNPTQFVSLSTHLASLGLVAICSDYRTRQSHGTTPFECIADGKSAIRWVRANARQLGIDPNRIAAAGGSAGGHVAASTAALDIEEPGADTAVSCVPNALVLFNPVVDTTSKGYGAKKIGERAREASPVHHLRPGMPPAAIFHGTADTTVRIENVQRFADSMNKLGNTCKLFTYEGGKHGFYRKAPYASTVLRETDTFLASLGWPKLPTP